MVETAQLSPFITVVAVLGSRRYWSWKAMLPATQLPEI